jgi:hypothetical protein
VAKWGTERGLSAWPVGVSLRLVGGREATLKFRVLVSLASVFAVGAIGTGVAGASSTPTEYFTATQTSVDGPQTVVAAGPISATGTDVQTGRHRDQFVFPDGVLTIRHEPVTTSQSYDSRTCVSRFVETGTYVIAKGTGAYAHATGSGHYKVVGEFQGCDQSQGPTAVSIVIQAHGPLTL